MTIAYNSYSNGTYDGRNYEGPVTAKENLPLTSTWTNITLSNITRVILNENGEGTSNNGSNNLPTAFSYEGYSARLLTLQEIIIACNANGTRGEFDNCNYLLENTKYSNSSLGTSEYWIETPNSSSHMFVNAVNASDRRSQNTIIASTSDSYGVRPAIEVLKTDIDY